MPSGKRSSAKCRPILPVKGESGPARTPTAISSAVLDDDRGRQRLESEGHRLGDGSGYTHHGACTSRSRSLHICLTSSGAKRFWGSGAREGKKSG